MKLTVTALLFFLIGIFSGLWIASSIWSELNKPIVQGQEAESPSLYNKCLRTNVGYLNLKLPYNDLGRCGIDPIPCQCFRIFNYE